MISSASGCIPDRPLIGIPCRQDRSKGYWQTTTNAQNDDYLNALIQAGGIPLLLPLSLDQIALKRLYDLADGILLAGGGDIDPRYYNQSPQVELADMQVERDDLEIQLSQWAMADGKPTLGICRGIQIMAVATGGCLCQDLPTLRPEAKLHHYAYDTEGAHGLQDLVHEVTLTSGSRLHHILKTESLWVNSLHHQAVETVADPLCITGLSSDGVVEVIEHPTHPFFCGVQWHPELLVTEHESARQIFQDFIEMCSEKRVQSLSDASTNPIKILK